MVANISKQPLALSYIHFIELVRTLFKYLKNLDGWKCDELNNNEV